MDEFTAGAIPGEQLKPLAPPKLGGTARTQLHPQAFTVIAAYDLGGTYANLDIKNTYHRGKRDTSLEDMFARQCPRIEKVGGFAACVRVSPDRASLHWYLPDRLTVDLSAPDEAVVRKMAADLPLARIAALSAAR